MTDVPKPQIRVYINLEENHIKFARGPGQVCGFSFLGLALEGCVRAKGEQVEFVLVEVKGKGG